MWWSKSSKLIQHVEGLGFTSRPLHPTPTLFTAACPSSPGHRGDAANSETRKGALAALESQVPFWSTGRTCVSPHFFMNLASSSPVTASSWLTGRVCRQQGAAGRAEAQGPLQSASQSHSIGRSAGGVCLSGRRGGQVWAPGRTWAPGLAASLRHQTVKQSSLRHPGECCREHSNWLVRSQVVGVCSELDGPMGPLGAVTVRWS